MVLEDLFGIDNKLNGSVREYMIYMEGLTDETEDSIYIQELVNEMPYETGDVFDDLAELETRGCLELETDFQGIYPVDIDGFNKILDRTGGTELEGATISLAENGMEYIDQMIPSSVGYIFSSKDN